MDKELCKICQNKHASYTCPRCNILYCSVQCYKSQQHLECSEGFFRENVVQELALRKADDDATNSTKSMLEILKRLDPQEPWGGDNSSEDSTVELDDAEEQIDSDDDERESELATRMEGVDLDDMESVWERLTSAEKQTFECLVENGDITKFLPEPDIWWTKTHEVDLIQPVEENSRQERELLNACPKIYSTIPKFDEIFKKEPSPTVRHNIANVLAAYSFVYRYFLGDIYENSLESADCLLSICLNLKSGAVFDSEALAIESIVNQCQIEGLPTDENTHFVLKADVCMFFAGPACCGKKYRKLYLLAALSDIRSLLGKANRDMKQLNNETNSMTLVKPGAEVVNDGANKETNSDVADVKHIHGPVLRNCQKKIDFFLAYVVSKFQK
ncbi:zinc finger HIT domain-containing protein 2 [Anopheles nili]|uniref:zinc finger HIT domain-containing protein 2 n=1 Tax=Anopheles nili TaxID=185578 RepID=UPI00237B5C78|nr:zinc finger HIT domain-containing protein 2 [Anopheles nili]